MENEKVRYDTKSFRIHKGTYIKLKELKQKKDISWNLFFYELINNYTKNAKTSPAIQTRGQTMEAGNKK